jgi:hypothetical protein
LDLPALRTRIDQATPIEGFYRICAQVGLELGPSFRGLVEFYRTSDRAELLMSIEPPDTAALEQDRFFMHPAVLDATVHSLLPLDPDGKPLGPIGSARYAVVSWQHRTAAAHEALDTLRATRPYVWQGGDIAPPEAADAIVVAALPSRVEIQELLNARIQPVVLALAAQLPYLRSIVALTPLPLRSASDRAQDRAASLRALVAERLAHGDVDAELAMLAPLFEEHDPALVAGALLALQRQTRNEKREASAPQPAQSGAWVRLFVTAGTKDRASAKDLVGALIKEAGLEKGHIGKIDVRETFSLVEIAPGMAEQAVRRLSGVSIRGRRVTARTDRA